jgi:hypothetical protein
VDDGISTGWICVNLGTIGWSDKEAEVVDADGEFSGFGVTLTGTTVVVQMFTESRREELDLESLWTGIANKNLEHAMNQGRVERGSASDNRWLSGGDASSSQRRMFSTSSRRLAAHAGDGLDGYLRAANFAQEAGFSDTTSDTANTVKLLEQMDAYLTSLPSSSVVQALRRGELSESGKASAFLRLFDRALMNLPVSERWGPRLRLQLTARKLGMAEWGLGDVAELVDELQVHGISSGRDQYADLIQAIFAHPAKDDAGLQEQSKLAMKVIDTMYERGQEVLSNDTVTAAIESLVRSGARGAETERLRSALEYLLEQADLPCMDEKLLIRLLAAYAGEGNWDKFWKIWRIPPRFQAGRSPDMYIFMFRLFADTRHQGLCIDAVRRCFHEMAHEDPPVHVRGAVLEALKACIQVADHEAEAIAQNLLIKDKESERLSNREFVKLLRSIEPTETR